MARPDDTEEEYLRYRLNVQRGDGPDQRGDVTVEVQRSLTDEDPDSVFADFALEADRATNLLLDQLALEDDR